VLILQPHSSWS